MFRNIAAGILCVAILALAGMVISNEEYYEAGLDQIYFVVSGDHSVSYDKEFLPSTVYYHGNGVKTIANPSPDHQTLVVYNFQTGDYTRIVNKCTLHSDRYLVTVEDKKGHKMAETVLEIYPD